MSHEDNKNEIYATHKMTDISYKLHNKKRKLTQAISNCLWPMLQPGFR